MKKILVLVVLFSLAFVACAPAGLQTRQTKITQNITTDGVNQKANASVVPAVEPVQPIVAVESAKPIAAGTTIHATRDIEVGDTTVHLDDIYTIPAPKTTPWVETDTGKAVLGILGILVGGAIITGGICGGTDLCNGTITFH